MKRLSLRLQLTLLYAVPFLLSGVALVSLPLLASSESQPVHEPLPSSPGVSDDASSPLGVVTAVAVAAMVALAFGFGWLIAGRFLRPVRTITATARDISATNLHRRLGLTGRDEFAELGRTLDGLFERLEGSFEAQRHFVANASHELRTPLTAEKALLQVALADPDATVESLRVTCRELLDLGEAQERLIHSLLTLAVGEQGVRRRLPVDLASVAASVVSAREEPARRKEITVRTMLGAAITTGDPGLVQSLTANLVDNALRHNHSGGWVEIVTDTVDGAARLTVGNSGPVVPPERVEQLFEPFTRLSGPRPAGSDGHGLGLAIVRAIARAHGARLIPSAPPGGGLTLTVVFPVDRE